MLFFIRTTVRELLSLEVLVVMRRIVFLFLLVFSLAFTVPVFANIPEIVIDGVVVQEKQESVIVETIRQVQEWYIADRQVGNNWVYKSSGSGARTFSEAFAQGKRWTQCADGTNKILKESGVLPLDTSHFFGAKDGTIHWGGNSYEVVSSLADIYQYADGTTVGQLRSSGFLQPGDVVTYMGFNHTNIYAGDGFWFDSGHANCTRSGENAPFWTFYGDHNKDGLKVGCVVRFRNQYPQPAIVIEEPSIVIEPVSSSVDEDGMDDGIFIWPSDEEDGVVEGNAPQEEFAETEGLQMNGKVSFIKKREQVK